MKTLFPLLAALLMVLNSFSQDHHRVDSLQTVLKSAYEDTNKVNTLNELSKSKCSMDEYAEAEKYANDALLLAERLDFKKGIACAYHNIGIVHWYSTDFNMALQYYQKALSLNKEIENKEGMAWDLGDIGLVYEALGDNLKELDYFLQALKINEQMKIQDAIAWNLRRIGVVYYNLSDFNKALEYYQKALMLEEKMGNKRGIANNIFRIGEVYFRQRNYPEALKKFLFALDKAKEMGSRGMVSAIHGNIGDLQDVQGNYSEALTNYFAAVKIAEEIGDKTDIGNVYSKIGMIYTKEGKYKEAREYLNKALTLSKESGSLRGYESIYNGFAELENALGNYKKAWTYKELYYAYRDSLVNGESSKKITTLQLQNDFDKKEELAKAENEKELQKQKLIRNGFVGGFAVVLLFAGVFFRQRNMTQIEKKRSENLLLNILPGEVAEEIKTTGTAKAKAYTMVTVMFTDFKDFTTVSEKVSAELLVDEIHTCFSAFDYILQKHRIEKIKTIGDAYLCASGLPVSNYTHAADMIQAAFEIRDYMLQRKKEKESRGEIPFELRIGIHTGPVVAGIVGVKKYAYDIWGDTVNLAARMEQNSEAGMINISGYTYELVKEKFACTHRGKIQAKNKGEIDMYFVETVS